VISLAIMAFNLLVLLSADKILGGHRGGAILVVGRIVGLLLTGLAMPIRFAAAVGLAGCGSPAPQRPLRPQREDWRAQRLQTNS
jgi:hypothetical protein